MKRAGAVAGAFLDLGLAVAEIEAAEAFLRSRATLLDQAVAATQALEALVKGWQHWAALARNKRPNIPLLHRYWPEEIAREMAARNLALHAALALQLYCPAAIFCRPLQFFAARCNFINPRR